MAKLAARGFEMTSRPAEVVARIVHTVRNEPPLSPGGATPWLWVSKRPVSRAIAHEAVRRGAYDVLSLDSRDVAAQIERRLKELLSAPVTPGRTELFAGKS
jgi:hypothetical protein